MQVVKKYSTTCALYFLKKENSCILPFNFTCMVTTVEVCLNARPRESVDATEMQVLI